MKHPKVNRFLTKKQDPHFEVPEEDNMENLHILMAIAWFFCNFYVFQLFNNLDISLFQLIQLTVVSIAMGFFVPIKVYRRKYTMSFYEYIFFNLLAVGPILCAAFLFLNVTFNSPAYTETYKIVSSERSNGNTVYNLEDKQYQDKVYLRTVKYNSNYKKGGNDYLKIRFSSGLFGIRIIESKSLH
ncbi:MAG: hypothetical protein RIC95_07515 [Vicingaceae bacterium]